MSRRRIAGKGIKYRYSDPDEPYRRLASEVIFSALQDYCRAYATNHPDQKTHEVFLTSQSVWHRVLQIDEDVYPYLLQKIRGEENEMRNRTL